MPTDDERIVALVKQAREHEEVRWECHNMLTGLWAVVDAMEWGERRDKALKMIGDIQRKLIA